MKTNRPAHYQKWLETLDPWHHDQDWKPLDTPTIHGVIPYIRAVFRHDCVGGNLHIVVHDYNVEDDSLEHCAEWIEESNYSEAQKKAERACFAALRPLTPEERASAIRLGERYP